MGRVRRFQEALPPTVMRRWEPKTDLCCHPGVVPKGFARAELGIEVVFWGQLAPDERVVMGLKAAARESLDLLMGRDAAYNEATIHILGSTEIEAVGRQM